VAAGLEAGLGGAGLGALVCGGGGEGGFFGLCALERNAQAKSMENGIRVLPTRERVLVGFMMSPLSSNSTLGTFIAGKDGTKTFHKSYGRLEGLPPLSRWARGMGGQMACHSEPAAAGHFLIYFPLPPLLLSAFPLENPRPELPCRQRAQGAKAADKFP